MPAARQAAGIASFGPMPMISGGTPRTAKDENFASGVRLNCFRIFSLTRISAPAPSEVCELLPAVTEPFAANTGLSFASASSVESARAPSSCVTVRVLISISPVARFGNFSTISTGQISPSRSPDCWAAIARRCDSSANWSCASREIFHCCATFSAVRPMPYAMPMFSSLKIPMFIDGRCPIIGTIDIDSAPAAIITSAWPTRMRSAAIATAVMPEAQ